MAETIELSGIAAAAWTSDAFGGRTWAWRTALKLTGLFTLAGTVAWASIEPVTVNFEYVKGLAKAEAAAQYVHPPEDLPASLRALNYDEYRRIRFKPDQALWAGDKLPFQLEFFHRGWIFHDRVDIHEFTANHEQAIPFLREFFVYEPGHDPGDLHSSLGYAGFRVHTPLNHPDVYDEVIAFLGASYFRAVAAQEVYGLSARGLAVDCGLVNQTEEFPRFTDFWVRKPAADDKALTIYALLKAPSVAGAYEFVVRPGAETQVDVRSELNFRHGVTLAGLAPLTSMFWFGENSDRPAGQLRLQVHDSDGLLVQDSVHRVWEPLRNPDAVENVDIPAHKLVRFGLMQRNRQIGGYEDLEAHYEERPSAWVEPQGDWGEGKVRLVELPAATEHDDNIVAFWVPATSPIPGHPVDVNYRIVWSPGEPPNGALARVVGTREGPLPGVERGHLFWVDFAGERPASGAAVKTEIELGQGGHLRHESVVPYPEIGGWRVAIEVDAAEAKKTISVQCRLRAGDQLISETWAYDWKS